MELTRAELKTRRALGKRLVMVRGKLTQDAFATQLGIHVNTLARYERGERLPGAEFLSRLSDNGINLHWLLTGNGQHKLSLREVSEPSSIYEALSFDSVKSKGKMRVQQEVGPSSRLCSNHSDKSSGYDKASTDSVCREELDQNPSGLFFDENWLEYCLGVRSPDICMVAMKGDSMEPTIQSGAQVLVDRKQTKSKENGFFLLRWGPKLLVRRLRFYPAGFCQVLCANPAYTSFVIRQFDESDSAYGDYEFQYLSEHHTNDGAMMNSDVVERKVKQSAGSMAVDASKNVKILGRVIWAGQNI